MTQSPPAMKWSLLLLFTIFFSYCKENNYYKQNVKPFSIVIQPLGGIDNWLLDSIGDQLKAVTNAFIIIRSNKPLPGSSYGPSRHRFIADSILGFLSLQSIPTGAKILGITNRDIETKTGNHPNWGVMGLAYCPGNSMIVSTFRVKEYPRLRKRFVQHTLILCLHELGHSYSLDHCPDKTCIMQDAKGKSRLDFSKHYCSVCGQKLVKAGLL